MRIQTLVMVVLALVAGCFAWSYLGFGNGLILAVVALAGGSVANYTANYDDLLDLPAGLVAAVEIVAAAAIIWFFGSCVAAIALSAEMSLMDVLFCTWMSDHLPIIVASVATVAVFAAAWGYWYENSDDDLCVVLN